MRKAVIHGLDQWITCLKENTEKISNAFHDTFYGRRNTPGFDIIEEAFNTIISHWTSGYEVQSHALENIIYANQYITDNGFYWTVEQIMGNYAALKYGTVKLFITTDYLELAEEKDYSELPVKEMLQIHGTQQMLPAEMGELFLSDIKKQSETVEDRIKDLDQLKQDIENAKTEELAAMQEEIHTLMEKMRKKKDLMLQDLYARMSEFEQKKQELEAQIYMLQAQIYTIRCYMGETVELMKIRDGKPAAKETPVVLNQKMLYLDEDLGRLVSLYQVNLQDYRLLEEALKYNDSVMESFCPQEKCITFFRVSQSGDLISFDKGLGILAGYRMLHGSKIGFCIRNGEKLFVGWMEETWEKNHSITFRENIIFQAGKTQIRAVSENAAMENTPVDERVSRMFALSVLRGLLEHKELIELPEHEDILKQSRYVIHNYADAWLDDNRYGDFGCLNYNLHQYNREGDVILLITNVSESYNSWKDGPKRGLSDGEVNRTHDCQVKSGINRINLVDREGNVYVSAIKECSEYGARSNFLIHAYEFINITYMNSQWMEYYITTKKVGGFGVYMNENGSQRHLTYAYMIQYFKDALEYLKKREKTENMMISQYVPLELYKEWPVMLSHWKLHHKVRTITDYQAKRFAKYLKNGRYFEMKHLFDRPFDLRFPDLENTYSLTSLPYKTSTGYRWSDAKEPNHKTYGHFRTYAETRFDANSGQEEIMERYKEDRKKLACIREDVKILLDTHGVTMEEVKKLWHEELKEADNYTGYVGARKKREIHTFCIRIAESKNPGDYMLLDKRDQEAVRCWLNEHDLKDTVFQKFLPLYYCRFLQEEYCERILRSAKEVAYRHHVEEIVWI